MLTCRAGAVSRQYLVAMAFSDVCHFAFRWAKKRHFGESIGGSAATV